MHMARLNCGPVSARAVRDIAARAVRDIAASPHLADQLGVLRAVRLALAARVNLIARQVLHQGAAPGECLSPLSACCNALQTLVCAGRDGHCQRRHAGAPARARARTRSASRARRRSFAASAPATRGGPFDILLQRREQPANQRSRGETRTPESVQPKQGPAGAGARCGSRPSCSLTCLKSMPMLHGTVAGEG